MTKVKLLTIALLLTASIGLEASGRHIKRTKNAITFTVDENLPAPRQLLHRFSGQDIARFMMFVDENMPQKDGTRILASSFENDSLYRQGAAVMFDLLRTAYADHRPVVLSPDAIWLTISQAFARYVNAHAEEMRFSIVAHKGKQDLSVTSTKDLVDETADWTDILQQFTNQLSKQTKGNLHQTITADFTTTGATERIVSQATLMDAFKTYFNYQVIKIVCGIPSISLTGTPDDWRNVLGKAQKLAIYPGIKPWTEKLLPILKEFVAAAEGRPNQSFWQNIVRRKRVDELRGGGCSYERPTLFDGWFLTFFPDKEGAVKDSVSWNYNNMPSGLVRVGFKFKRMSSDGHVLSQVPLELWAGFTGIDVDKTTQALTPRLGWLVRTANEEDEMVHKLYMQNCYGNGLKFTNLTEVPLALSQLLRIERLELAFSNDRIELPDWFYKLIINHLTIRGAMSEAEETRLRQNMKDCSDITIIRPGQEDTKKAKE